MKITNYGCSTSRDPIGPSTHTVTPTAFAGGLSWTRRKQPKRAHPQVGPPPQLLRTAGQPPVGSRVRCPQKRGGNAAGERDLASLSQSGRGERRPAWTR